MLILTYNLFNFIEIMNWVFEIPVSIFGCESRVVEEESRRLLKFMYFLDIKIFIL